MSLHDKMLLKVKDNLLSPIYLFSKNVSRALSASTSIKVLGISKYSLLGFSAGGMNAVIQAGKYPEHVNKLVIWSMFSFMTQYDLETCKNFSDTNAWSNIQLKPILQTYGETLFKKYRTSWVALAYDTYKNGGDICTEYMKDIKCPTFVLYGQKDLLDVNIHIPYTSQHIKGSRLYVYPEGRHHIHINYADDFYKRVEEFCWNLISSLRK